SGNGNNGIYVADVGTDGNVIAGNYIGTDPAGTAAIGNAWTGVAVLYGAKNNRIGTNADGANDIAERNLISGNGNNGVYLYGTGTNGTVVAGNYIGTNISGTAAVGNSWSGV